MREKFKEEAKNDKIAGGQSALAHVAEDETLRKLIEEFNNLEDDEEWGATCMGA